MSQLHSFNIHTFEDNFLQNYFPNFSVLIEKSFCQAIIGIIPSKIDNFRGNDKLLIAISLWEL